MCVAKYGSSGSFINNARRIRGAQRITDRKVTNSKRQMDNLPFFYVTVFVSLHEEDQCYSLSPMLSQCYGQPSGLAKVSLVYMNITHFDCRNARLDVRNSRIILELSCYEHGSRQGRCSKLPRGLIPAPWLMKAKGRLLMLHQSGLTRKPFCLEP